MTRRAGLLLFMAVWGVCIGCGSGVRKKNILIVSPASQTFVPAFNADSAYRFVERQTEFGPRVPNTQAHRDCAAFLAEELTRLGAETITQSFKTTAFDGTVINGFNIIGQIAPQNPKRIVICSHWDSRPWADNDPDPANWKSPVLAANDGASGVGVILEIARQLQQTLPGIGVDCIFLDAEDWGPGPDYTEPDAESYWALGTQYWSRNPHKSGYKARYAILLDMVGGQDAHFFQEGVSLHFAPELVKKVWDAAHSIGFGNFFPKTQGGFVTDDHLFINNLAHIPAIDIIPYYPTCKQSGFGPTWHTVSDNMEHIDRATLQAVGQTLLQVIYNE